VSVALLYLKQQNNLIYHCTSKNNSK